MVLFYDGFTYSVIYLQSDWRSGACVTRLIHSLYAILHYFEFLIYYVFLIFLTHLMLLEEKLLKFIAGKQLES